MLCDESFAATAELLLLVAIKRCPDVEPEFDYVAVGYRLACRVVLSIANFPLSNSSG